MSTHISCYIIFPKNNFTIVNLFREYQFFYFILCFYMEIINIRSIECWWFPIILRIEENVFFQLLSFSNFSFYFSFLLFLDPLPLSLFLSYCIPSSLSSSHIRIQTDFVLFILCFPFIHKLSINSLHLFVVVGVKVNLPIWNEFIKIDVNQVPIYITQFWIHQKKCMQNVQNQPCTLF